MIVAWKCRYHKKHLRKICLITIKFTFYISFFIVKLILFYRCLSLYYSISFILVVPGDSNKGRRDAVRRKTAQYLMKAEDLFNRHLSTEKVDERRWGVSGSGK